MEFTNEIFFNKKLTQNETVLITYSGKLYKEYSAEITIVYGFGENWDYTQETKMQEKENGFEAAITMKNYDTFNFCFKNNYNIWDNNSGFNYIAAIEPAKVADTTNEEQSDQIKETTNEEKNVNPELNDNLIENKNIETTNIVNNGEDSLSEIEKQAAIEEAFNNLLNSIMDIKEDDVNKNVNLENGFGLQSVDEIKETDFTSCDDIFKDLYNELAQIEVSPESNIQNTSNETQNMQEISKQEDTSQLETLLNDFSAKQEKKKQLVTGEELDEIMNNILNSIIEEDSLSQDNVQTVTTEENSESTSSNTSKDNFRLENEIYGLPAKKQSSFEDFVDKCIDGTYSFFRSVWNGCKKVGILIKQKTRELIGEEDK